MRTTLTLDSDVAERLKQEIRRTGRGLKRVVNDALRHGLGLSGKPVRAKRFEVIPLDLGIKAGVDPDRMNQLVDELDAAEARRRYEP
jgi:Ribbon-helix-helix protein, copG family